MDKPKRIGRYPTGQNHHMAKHTDHEVELMRQLHEEGMSYPKIAELMETNKWTVGAICRHTNRAVKIDYKPKEEPKPIRYKLQRRGQVMTRADRLKLFHANMDKCMGRSAPLSGNFSLKGTPGTTVAEIAQYIQVETKTLTGWLIRKDAPLPLYKARKKDFLMGSGMRNYYNMREVVEFVRRVYKVSVDYHDYAEEDSIRP